MSWNFTGPGTLILGVLLTAGVGAQESSEPEEKDEVPARAQETRPDIPIIEVTVTVNARPLDSNVQDVTTIERVTIEASGARTVAELLRYVTGVHVVGGGTRATLSTTQIRGGDANFSVVLLDGVPLNDATDILGGAVNLATLPTTSVERVEIARGPASFFHGSAALAGVINIVTRRGSRTNRDASFELEAGNASLRRAAGSLTGGFRYGDYALALQWEQEEGRIGADRFDQMNLYGKLGLSLGENAELLFSTRYASTTTDDYPEASGGPVYGTGEPRSSDAELFDANVELLSGEAGRRSYRFFAKFHQSRLDRESPGVPPVVPNSIENTNYSRVRLGGSTVLYRGAGLSINAGVDADHESADNASVLAGVIPGDYRESRTTGGIFGELIAESGPFLVEGGARVVFPPGLPAEWIPRVGGSYRLPNGTSRIRASFSGGFKLPSFFALASPPALGGNPALAPETSRGVDVGWVQQLGGSKLETRASVFFNRYKNLVDFDFDEFSHVNRGTVNSSGVEWSLDWRPEPLWWLATQLTWNKVRDRATDAPLLHRPEWLFGAQVGFRPSSSLTLWVDAQAVSKQLDNQLPVPDRDEVPGYGILGLSAALRFASRWELRARIDNLTDTEYETFIGFPGPGIATRVSIRYFLNGEERP